jgi:hypothetical protein
VEFDIAVTVREGKETAGGIGVVVGAVALGSRGKSTDGNTTVSRLKFQVPVMFPTSSKELPRPKNQKLSDLQP